MRASIPEEKSSSDALLQHEEEEEPWSRALRKSLGRGNIAPYKEPRRPMLSRVYAPALQVVSADIEPGQHVEGCCVCVPAPDYCPCMACLPCIGEPLYIHRKREGSKYVLLRENSIEWNAPQRVAKNGSCFAPQRCEYLGISCVLYDIQDHVNVVYFDDPIIDKISSATWPCHKNYERCCGGEGELVQMSAPACGGLCYRGRLPCCLVPAFCPHCCCPCGLQKSFFVKTRGREGNWKGAPQAVKLLQQLKLTANKRLPSVTLGECGTPLPVAPSTQEIDRDHAGVGQAEKPSEWSLHSNPLATDARQSEKDAEVRMISHHLSKATQYADYNTHRNMFTRVYGPVQQLYGVDRSSTEVKIGITKELEDTGSSIPPAVFEQPVCACCFAPVYCPCCSVLPCCMQPKYIHEKREASRYILIRENSIEWNDPKTVAAPGPWYCGGISCVLYDVEDDVKVLYFDDPVLQRIRDSTRVCNETRTVCCGGIGERIQIDSPLCCGLCLRGKLPCPIVPCCLAPCMWCALTHTINVQRPNGDWGGASMAVDLLRKAWVDNVVRLMDEQEQNRLLGGHFDKKVIRDRRGSRADAGALKPEPEAKTDADTEFTVSASSVEMVDVRQRKPAASTL